MRLYTRKNSLIDHLVAKGMANGNMTYGEIKEFSQAGKVLLQYCNTLTV